MKYPDLAEKGNFASKIIAQNSSFLNIHNFTVFKEIEE